MELELVGNKISLIELAAEHIEALSTFSTDPEIWRFLSISFDTKEEIYQWFDQSKAAASEGKVIPFVIRSNKTAAIVGSTRLFDVDTRHKTAEIGWTWLDPKFFGQQINLEAKLLLLSYSFEKIGLNRVQFKTDVTNLRSQKALVKIGAQFEGILRNHKIRRDGSLGNSMVYSIIISEWPQAKQLITQKLNENSLSVK